MSSNAFKKTYNLSVIIAMQVPKIRAALASSVMLLKFSVFSNFDCFNSFRRSPICFLLENQSAYFQLTTKLESLGSALARAISMSSIIHKKCLESRDLYKLVLSRNVDLRFPQTIPIFPMDALPKTYSYSPLPAHT